MTRLEKLKRLEDEIYSLMQKANTRTYSSLARQYRETIKEIEEIEGTDNGEDEIADILQSRSADGKPRAVRPDRSKLSTE